MIIVALGLMCIGCSKTDDDMAGALKPKSLSATAGDPVESYPIITWTENFNTPSVLDNNWTLYGSPEPQWVEEAYGQAGLFDNNGPSPTTNYGVSHSIVGKGLGFSVESQVMLKILDPKGACICPGIAVSRSQNPVTYNNEILTGICFRLIYAGGNATWFPAELRGHTWFYMEYLNENGGVTYSDYMPADAYSNTWHKLKIVVTPARNIRFYCDNIPIWSPLPLLLPNMASDKNVVLGYTSSGDTETRAGVAYHNWVKVSYYNIPGIFHVDPDN